MDIKGIKEGYGNLIFRKEEVERRAMLRLKVCRSCPLKRDGVIETCGQCGCPIHALARQNQKICKNWRTYGV